MKTIRRGDRGPEVTYAQELLGIGADGIFGGQTDKAVRKFQREHGLEADGVVGPRTWAALEVKPEPSPSPESGIQHCGAWAGSWALRYPEKAVELALSIGLTRLDIICNDHSKWRRPAPFSHRDKDDILALAWQCHAAKLDVHLMSWAMPHAEYIDGLCVAMSVLGAATEAQSIQLDLEEPWTQAVDPLDYVEAADRFESLLETWPGDFGVNGIPYTDAAKVAPMIGISDYKLVQAYSTASSGVKPHRVDNVAERWRKIFVDDKPLQVGLAAYRQGDIEQHTKTSAIETAYREVSRMADVDTVVYWQLKSFRDKEVARALRKLRKA